MSSGSSSCSDFETRLSSLHPDSSSSSSASFYRSDRSECSKILRKHCHDSAVPSEEKPNVLDQFCSSHPNSAVCKLYAIIRDGNIMDFIKQIDDPIHDIIELIREFLENGIDISRLESAIKTFLENIEVPNIEIPITKTLKSIENTGVGIFQRTYGYAVLGGFLCLLILVWGLVLFGTFHWTFGLILTIVFVLIYYILTVFYSEDLPNFVERQTKTIIEPYQQLLGNLGLTTLQIPSALQAAIENYINQ